MSSLVRCFERHDASGPARSRSGRPAGGACGRHRAVTSASEPGAKPAEQIDDEEDKQEQTYGAAANGGSTEIETATAEEEQEDQENDEKIHGMFDRHFVQTCDGVFSSAPGG